MKNLLSVIKYILLIVFLIAFSTSCTNEEDLMEEGETIEQEDEQNEDQELNTIFDNVYVIGGNIELQELEVSENEIKFNMNQGDALNLIVGDVLISDISSTAPSGYMRKIESINQTNGELIINTRIARLDEVFETANIRSKRTFDGVEVVTRNTIAEPEVEFEISHTILDLDDDPETTEDQVNIVGSVGFSGEIDFDVDITPSLRLAYFNFGSNAITETSLTLQIGGSIELFEIEETVMNIPLPSFTVYVPVGPAPLPIVVTPRIEVVVGANGSINSVFEATVIRTDTYTSNVTFDKNAGWSANFNHDREFDYEFGGTASITANTYLRPEVIYSLYNFQSAGVKIPIERFIKYELDLATEEWELYTGVNVSADVFLEGYGVELTYSEPLFELITPIDSGSLPNSEVELSDFTSNGIVYSSTEPFTRPVFSNDGMHLYAIRDAKVEHFELNEPFSFSGINQPDEVLAISGNGSSTAQDVAINNDGTILYIRAEGPSFGNDFYQKYDLSTPYSLENPTYVNNTTFFYTHGKMQLSPNNEKFYSERSDATFGSIFQYNFNVEDDISSITNEGISPFINGGAGGSFTYHIAPDGESVYVTNPISSGVLQKYKINTPWEIETMDVNPIDEINLDVNERIVYITNDEEKFFTLLIDISSSTYFIREYIRD